MKKIKRMKSTIGKQRRRDLRIYGFAETMLLIMGNDWNTGLKLLFRKSKRYIDIFNYVAHYSFNDIADEEKLTTPEQIKRITSVEPHPFRVMMNLDKVNHRMHLGKKVYISLWWKEGVDDHGFMIQDHAIIKVVQNKKTGKLTQSIVYRGKNNKNDNM